MERITATGAQRDTAVQRAAELLTASELVVLPTDTVYALAAHAFDLDATAALLRAKDRDRTLPLSVLVRSPKQLSGLTELDDDQQTVLDRLVAAFWPGPLTIVLPAQPGLRWDLGRTAGTVAVRMPLDDVTLAVIRSVGPLAVSAANTVGEPPARDAAAAATMLAARAAAVVDDGPRRRMVTSTIVDLTRGNAIVLRPGAVPGELIDPVADGSLDALIAAERWADAEAVEE